MGSGWPTFSENTLMLYQQDLQLGQYFLKWQLAIDRGLPRYPINNFAEKIIVAQIPGVMFQH